MSVYPPFPHLTASSHTSRTCAPYAALSLLNDPVQTEMDEQRNGCLCCSYPAQLRTPQHSTQHRKGGAEGTDCCGFEETNGREEVCTGVQAASRGSITVMGSIPVEMDEAEMYQQRLQIIARKSIRDKWLMEPTLSSMEAHGPGSMPGSSPQRTEESTEEAKIITQIEEDMDITENMNYEQSSQIVEKPLPLSDKVEKHIEVGSATSENALNPRILLENGQLKRSVLGILEVQGERELKTGATTMIMASLSAVAPEAPGEIVFDDDHQTVHTMRGIKDRLPSGKELNQILEVVSEVSVQGTLDSVALTCNESCGEQKETEAGIKELEVEPSAEAVGGLSDLDHDVLQQKNTPGKEDLGFLANSKTEFEMAEGLNEGRDGGTEDRDGGKGGEGEVDVEGDVWEMVYCNPEKGLNELTSLDFMQAQPGLGPLHYKDDRAVPKVEQDCITDEKKHLEVGPSETKSKGKEFPESEESKSDSVTMKLSYLDGSQEDMQQEVTLQIPCFDTEVASDASVPLQELSNVLGILAAEEAPKNSIEIWQNLPQSPTNTNNVVEDAKEILDDSTRATPENKEEQGTSTARTGAEVEGVGKIVRKESTVKGFEDEIFQEVPLEGKKELLQSFTQREIAVQSIEQEPELL
ncbi:hypothetical protein P4O66_007494, partial [Electrophorus voltai]